MEQFLLNIYLNIMDKSLLIFTIHLKHKIFMDLLNLINLFKLKLIFLLFILNMVKIINHQLMMLLM